MTLPILMAAACGFIIATLLTLAVVSVALTAHWAISTAKAEKERQNKDNGREKTKTL